MGQNGFLFISLLAVGVGYGGYQAIQKWGNVLSGFNGEETISPWKLQAVATAFCLSPLPWTLETKEIRTDDEGVNYDFVEEGNVAEEDYTKDSIYAIFYSLYQAMGKAPSPSGTDYQFTFNTWGISNVDWILSEAEPQRHGKAAYQGLVEFKEVKQYLEANPNPQIVEIGCGTGAGANFITQLIPGCKYTAFDMQQAAIDTCNLLHAKDNPRLKCEWVPGGVGGSSGNNKAPVPDSSVDIVVISETHIAEWNIGPEEKAIFKEIIRMLKPGGFFVWGNALPTRVWHMAEPVLAELGMETCGSLNHTQGAVQARLEDEARVNMYVQHVLDFFPVTSIPHFGPRCRRVTDRLIKNFYRHPGTKLYKQMVTGWDSYMHTCHKKTV
jgi:SAM-dependent methyltransferase